MRFRRALLLIGPGQDPGPALAGLRAIAPTLPSLLIRLQSAPTLAGSLLPVGWGALSAPESAETSAQTLETLVAATNRLAAHVELVSGELLDATGLSELCIREGIDLLAPAVWSLRHERLVNEVRRRAGAAVLWPGGQAEVQVPLAHVGCVARSARGGLRISAWLNSHLEEGPECTFTLLTTHAPTAELVSRTLAVSGLRVPVKVSPLQGWSQVQNWLTGDGEVRFGLLIVPRPPPLLALGAGHAAPVLVLPPMKARVEPPPGPEMVGADAIDDLGILRLCVEGDVTFGAPHALPDGTLTLFSAGRPIGATPLRNGVAATELTGIEALGLSRGEVAATPEAIVQVEAQVEVIRPADGPLFLFDADLPDTVLVSLHGMDTPDRPRPLAVRMRPTRGLRAIRERLRAHGLQGRVLDARAVLDEGPGYDVDTEALDALRLARVAERMQQAGFTVGAIIHRGPRQPAVAGVHAIDASTMGVPTAALARGDVQAPVEQRSPLLQGNAIELELDNGRARAWLLEAIRGAERTFCFQVYMCADDEVGREVADALIDAGARGVTVRVLVDSLHGRHGSFGAQNPLLVRLAGRPGVELRVAHPINALPSLKDLKQRDHRKLAVSDSAVAMVGGRNLSHEYYAAWDEVALGPESHWRDVPWVDAGARVRGPAVGALLGAFRVAWMEAGGTPFSFQTPPPAGTSAARVVVHHGLRDARSLETYRELIEGARSHVMIANGFPFVLELQHGLLEALARGVRVRVLTGHLTPTFGDGRPFKGPWSTAREAATELVHSRLDPLIAAGAEVHLAQVGPEPAWDAAIGAVRPHVHAKVLTVDGRACTVGSANLDVTASYWESELLLVTEDPALVRDYEATLAALLDRTPKVDRDDPAWREKARARRWMAHWPGVLSI